MSGVFSLTNRATISTTSEGMCQPRDTTEVWSTVGGEPPLKTALVSPVDGVAANDDKPVLSWNASPSTNVAGYLLDLDGTVLFQTSSSDL